LITEMAHHYVRPPKVSYELTGVRKRPLVVSRN
jgi:hypothetical protein